jgi:hypothetical protein
LRFGVADHETLVQLEEQTEHDAHDTIRTKDRQVKIHSTWNFLMAEGWKWTKKQPNNQHLLCSILVLFDHSSPFLARPR